MTGQTQYAVAIGFNAGEFYQGGSSVAVGRSAGMTGQATNSVAIGREAGFTTQGSDSVAVGYLAGYANQSTFAVAIGREAGESFQATNTVAVGYLSGNTAQGTDAVAVGRGAGQTGQSTQAVAIGSLAGRYGQGSSSVAIGREAGTDFQGSGAVAIGLAAGQTGQAQNSVAIGSLAGRYGQGQNAIAIGRSAGNSGQAIGAVAVGTEAGYTGQNQYSIAIGFRAGYVGQAANSTILNATSTQLNAGTTGLFVRPIRFTGSTGTSFGLTYDPTLAEITYNTFGTATGPSYQIQYSDGGAFGSTAAFQYNPTTYSLSVLSQTGNTGTLFVDGINNRVGIGTTGPQFTLDVQGDCNLSGSVYRIKGVEVLSNTALGTGITGSSLTTLGTLSQGVNIASGQTFKVNNVNVLSSTTLGSSVVNSSLQTLGTLSSALNIASGQSYRINNVDVLSATSLGAGVTGSSLTSVGNLSSLTTTGAVNFFRSTAATTPNFNYNPTTNVATFGQGSTGGQFTIIGDFVQGVTGSTGTATGGAKMAYRNVGRYVEIASDSDNISYIDFHSLDNVQNDYDSRILSVGGVTGANGRGAMGLEGSYYAFSGYPNGGGGGGINGSTGQVKVDSYVEYRSFPYSNTSNIRTYSIARRVYSGQMVKSTAATYTLDCFGDGNYGLYGMYYVYFMNKKGGYANGIATAMRGTSANPGNTNFVTWDMLVNEGNDILNLVWTTGSSNWCPQITFKNTSNSDAYFIVTADGFSNADVFNNPN